MSLIASSVPRVFFPAFFLCVCVWRPRPTLHGGQETTSCRGKYCRAVLCKTEARQLVMVALQSSAHALFGWPHIFTVSVSPADSRRTGMGSIGSLEQLAGRNRVPAQRGHPAILWSHRHLVVRRENSCEKGTARGLLPAGARHHHQPAKYLCGKANQRKKPPGFQHTTGYFQANISLFFGIFFGGGRGRIKYLIHVELVENTESRHPGKAVL